MCFYYLFFILFKKNECLDESTQTNIFLKNTSSQTLQLVINRSTQTEYNSDDEWEKFIWTKDINLI